MATVREALCNANATLVAVSDEPQIDAEYLLTHLMDMSITQLVINADKALSEHYQRQFDQLIKRRLNGEPIAYITKQKNFHEITLTISPDVLIPRSDTELLVELALERIASGRPTSVLDLGTGSGAIALSVAVQRPLASITAIDESIAACEVAQKNADNLQLQNVKVLSGSWFEPINDNQYNVIVSNPPYLSEHDPHLLRGDLRFEPKAALVASDNGLACFKHIAIHAKQHLVMGGSLLFEHGFDQSEAVKKILNEQQFTHVQTYQDLSGNGRVTVGVYS